METVLDYSVEFLKVHPRNNEFYDDISGEDYEQFKATIQNEGVLTPLIVAPDMTVISGHQRLKASKDLGVATVPIIIRQDIKTEEDKMTVLLATNYGRPDSAKKKRKIADEYVKLRGNGRGGDRKSKGDNRTLKLSEIAKQLGTNERTLKEMLAIERKLTPEFKEMLDAGIFTETTASKILVKLPKEIQEKLITTYGKDIIEGVTQKQMQEYVDRIKEFENKPPKIIDKTDYSTIDSLKSQLSTKEADISKLKRDINLLEQKVQLNQNEANKYNELKSGIEFLTKQKADIIREIQATTELSGLVVEIDNILKTKLAPVKYSRVMEQINNEIARGNLIDIVESVQLWCDEMRKIYKKQEFVVIEGD